MKKIISRLKNIPPYARLPIVISAVSHFLVYYIPLLFGRDTVRTLSSAFDSATPLIPAFAYIYVAAFPFWVLGYIRIYSMSPYMAKRMLFADLFCKVIATLCYCLYPCTLIQPAAEEISGIGAWLLKIVYFMDKPTNLLPSMHCFVSWLCARPLLSRYAKGESKMLRTGSTVFAILIFASTVFTKQHVIADVITGAAVAEAGWLISRAVIKREEENC